jgi:hypothetical protein
LLEYLRRTALSIDIRWPCIIGAENNLAPMELISELVQLLLLHPEVEPSCLSATCMTRLVRLGGDNTEATRDMLFAAAVLWSAAQVDVWRKNKFFTMRQVLQGWPVERGSLATISIGLQGGDAASAVLPKWAVHAAIDMRRGCISRGSSRQRRFALREVLVLLESAAQRHTLVPSDLLPGAGMDVDVATIREKEAFTQAVADGILRLCALIIRESGSGGLVCVNDLPVVMCETSRMQSRLCIILLLKDCAAMWLLDFKARVRNVFAALKPTEGSFDWHGRCWHQALDLHAHCRC